MRTQREVKEFLGTLRPVISIDTETTSLNYHSLKLEGVSLCDGTKACYIFLADFDKEYVNPEYTDILDTLRVDIHSRKELVFHNAVYDMTVLYKYGMTLFNNPELFCTMIADHLINENRKHGLKFLARELLGYETTDYDDIKDHSSQEFFDYAINDAVYTYELMLKQKDLLQEEGLVHLFRDIEMPFQYVLRDMRINGMLVDTNKIEEKRKKVQDYLFVLYQELLEASGVDSSFNFNSSKQLSDLLYNKLGLEIKERTPSGAPSVGSEALEKLNHPVVQKLLEYKGYQKILSSYLNPDAQILKNLDPDNRVRPSFLDFGTTTGRLSCNSPNLQQLPKVKEGKEELDVRECFVVPEDKVMITCDYSGQELRVLAEITREPVLVDTFIKGKDMHLSTANDFFSLGIPEKALYEEDEEHEYYKKKFKEERNKAKTINFGMAYGKGAYGFSKDFGISEDEAQEILDKYFAALPKVKEGIEKCHEEIRQQGYTTSMTGRKRHFEKQRNRYGAEYYPNSCFRQGFNFLIQGFSADMIRIALNNVRALGLRRPDLGIKIIATVHDEIICEVNKDKEDESASLIKESMESAVTFCVPVVAEIGRGRNYSQAK